jgi:hypothetical protein
MRLFDLLCRRGSPPLRPSRPPLCLEPLESRTVPYAASGNLWPHPELVTISFEPDGTDLGGQSSNLFGMFNSAFGSPSAWQTPILKAAQTWAQQTNLNFSVVTDNGAASGSGNNQQGDPGFGDIRIGGFAFGNSSALALGYMPPKVNNYSVAGDIVFNTGQAFNINGLDYDLYTVALHEFGHALGLNHSSTTSAVMYSAYQGIQSGLYADDVAGIRSIYSGGNPRGTDPGNNSFATATDLTSSINSSSLTAAVTGLDVSSTSDTDYYQFTVPAGATGTLSLTVKSSGFSLLAPSIRVYNASEVQLTSATGTGYNGSTLTRSVSVTPGQTYYIRVAGANTTAFGTGAYALTLNFGSGPSPTVLPPNTQTPNGNPLNGGGGVANRTDSNGVSVSVLISGLGNGVDGTLAGLGLNGLGQFTGDVLGGVNQDVNGLVDLPFVDLLFVPAAGDRTAGDPDPAALSIVIVRTAAPVTGPLLQVSVSGAGERLPSLTRAFADAAVGPIGPGPGFRITLGGGVDPLVVGSEEGGSGTPVENSLSSLLPSPVEVGPAQPLSSASPAGQNPDGSSSLSGALPRGDRAETDLFRQEDPAGSATSLGGLVLLGGSLSEEIMPEKHRR